MDLFGAARERGGRGAGGGGAARVIPHLEKVQRTYKSPQTPTP